MLATKNLGGSFRATVWLRGVPLLVLLGLVSCTPPGPKALLEGQRLVRTGEFAQAVERCLVATELLPSNAHAWNYLGLAYHGAGKPEEARKAYTQALSYNRDLVIVRFNLGCLLLEMGDYPSSVNELTSFTFLEQQSEQGYVKLASAQIKTRAYDAAEASLKRALQLNPKNPETLNNLGYILLQKRRGREAYNQFLAAIQSDSKYAPALLNLAIVSQQMNNRPLALKAFKDYLLHRKEPSLPGPELIEAWIAQLTSELQPVPKPQASTLPNAKLAEATTRSPASPTNLPDPHNSEPVARPSRNAVPASPDSSVIPATAQSPLLIEPKPTLVKTAQSPVPGVSDSIAIPVVAPPVSVAKVQEPSTSTTATLPLKSESELRLPTKRTEPSTLASPVEKSVQSPVFEAVKTTPQEPDKQPSVPSNVTPPVRVSPPALETTSASPVASQAIQDGSREALAKEEKAGLWQRVNPVRWFRGSEKRSPASTPIPDSKPSDLGQRTQRPTDLQAVAANRQTDPPSPVLPSVRRSDSVNPASESSPAPIPRAGPRYRSSIVVPLTAGDLEKSRQELNAGLEFRENGRLEDALKAYRRAVAMDPRHHEAHFALALGLAESNDLPGSLAAYDAAVSLKPDAIPARYNFALALRKSRFPQDAAENAAAILRNFPNEVRAHLLLGSLWAGELGVFAKAREHYRIVLEIEPRHAQAGVIRTWLATHP